MAHTAGWCKECDGPVWLPHDLHPEGIVVEYDAGKRPLLRTGKPRPPEILEIKRYRAGLASELMHAGGVEEAVAVLEDLVKYTDRDVGDEEERLLDYDILSDLAYGLMRLWRLDESLAVLARMPLNTRRLDEPRQRALGLRALVHYRLGETFYSQRDRDRLYAQDPRHPLLDEIERESATGVEPITYAPRPSSAGASPSSTA